MHSENKWKYHIARYFFNQGQVDRQAEICDVFTYDMGYKVVEYAEDKHGYNRHASVVAVKDETGKVVAFVVLSRVIERKINGDMKPIFCYKIISENECPIDTINCTTLIKMLTPTQNPFALVWRGMCSDRMK